LKFKDSEEKEKLKVGFEKLPKKEVASNDYILNPAGYKKFAWEAEGKFLSLAELVEKVAIRNHIKAPV
jgi:hypothetical protein